MCWLVQITCEKGATAPPRSAPTCPHREIQPPLPPLTLTQPSSTRCTVMGTPVLQALANRLTYQHFLVDLKAHSFKIEFDGGFFFSLLSLSLST